MPNKYRHKRHDQMWGVRDGAAGSRSSPLFVPRTPPAALAPDRQYNADRSPPPEALYQHLSMTASSLVFLYRAVTDGDTMADRLLECGASGMKAEIANRVDTPEALGPLALNAADKHRRCVEKHMRGHGGIMGKCVPCHKHAIAQYIIQFYTMLWRGEFSHANDRVYYVNQLTGRMLGHFFAKPKIDA